MTWRSLPTAALEDMLQLDITDALYDDILYELAQRSIPDDRIAQASGNAQREEPS